MEKIKESGVGNSLRILIVGNNPIDLSKLLEKLKRVENKQVITEIAFDVHSLADRLAHFTADYILVDDNIGRAELRSVVKILLKDRRTKSTPITVLKNSNYHEAFSSGVLDFLLKENLTGDAIYRALQNSLKLRQTQQYFYKAYKRRKGQLARLFTKTQPAFQI
jgi:CheY-like chemotaxis protein